jgi:hypothetical protein
MFVFYGYAVHYINFSENAKKLLEEAGASVELV